MTSPPSGSDRRQSARRLGRVSALIVGTIAVITVVLVAMVGWPSLWWDVATNTRPPGRSPFRRGLGPSMKSPPPAPVPALSDWRSEPFEKPLAEVRNPVVRETRRSLAGPRRTAPGLAVTEVRVAGAFPVLPVPPPHVGLYAGACWAADGRSFFVVSTNGELHQISCPDLVQTRMAELGTICRQVNTSAAGLVLTLPSVQELWVLDPEALTIRRRIGVVGLRRVLTAPDLTIAYALVMSPDRGSGPPTRVDLTDGTQTGLTVPSTSSGFDFRRAAMLPDGRSLFAEGVPGRLVRYQVEGDRLTAAEETEPIVRGDRGLICVSPDGRWVCLPAWDGHANRDGEQFVYASGNLSSPAFYLKVGTGCHVMAFDPAGGRVCATSFEHPLLLFDAAGKPGPIVPRELFPDAQQVVEALIPRPDGRQLLVLTTESVFLVDFTGRS
ncbi:MAG TPA: hypothetical protein VL371_07290 [Gemmataceae bacterium]|jgi:hypothetical protein|nr:hypothetical protein [Gemmataceae bacterium]